MPEVTAKQKLCVIALIILGFVWLLGARELAATAPPVGAARAVGPAMLIALGALCFVAAGLMARRLMR